MLDLFDCFYHDQNLTLTFEVLNSTHSYLDDIDRYTSFINDFFLGSGDKNWIQGNEEFVLGTPDSGQAGFFNFRAVATDNYKTAELKFKIKVVRTFPQTVIKWLLNLAVIGSMLQVFFYREHVWNIFCRPRYVKKALTINTNSDEPVPIPIL